jgi:hypothetical protein
LLDEIFGSDDPEAEVERVLNQLAVIAAGALVDTVIDGDAEYDEDNPPVPSAADAIAALSAKLQAELMANLD